jgi:peptidoglycan/LPS O-acetylase OafA/YrhL
MTPDGSATVVGSPENLPEIQLFKKDLPYFESPNLDLLRAVAVLAVYCVHLNIMLGRNPNHKGYMGPFGVLIFFTHTSLVLMMSLHRLESSDRPLFSTFYLRRWFRIYPLSIVCVLLVLLLHLPQAPWEPVPPSYDTSTVLANLLLCTNLFYKDVVISVLWSLPYEIQMCVVLPFIYLAGKAYGARGIIVLWCAAVGAALVLPHISARLDIARFAPCFMAGVLSYFLGFGTAHKRLPFMAWPATILAAGCIMALGHRFDFQMPASWLLCLLIGASAPYCVEMPWPFLRRAAALIARYSYGIYLTHIYAQWVALVILRDEPVAVRIGALVVLSVGMPLIAYHLIEAPMIAAGVRLSRRLPAKSPATPVPAIS